MRTNNKSLRNQFRLIHLLTSIFLGLFIYSPLKDNPQFVMFVRFGVCPVVAVSGIWMWKGKRIQQGIKGLFSSSTANQG